MSSVRSIASRQSVIITSDTFLHVSGTNGIAHSYSHLEATLEAIWMRESTQKCTMHHISRARRRGARSLIRMLSGCARLSRSGDARTHTGRLAPSARRSGRVSLSRSKCVKHVVTNDYEFKRLHAWHVGAAHILSLPAESRRSFAVTPSESRAFDVSIQILR